MVGPVLKQVDLAPATNDIQEILDSISDANREGTLSAITVAVVYRDGTTGKARSTLPNYSLMLGAVERLKYALVRDAEG